MSINKLILGDNLEILKSMEADSVNFVYVRLLSNSLFLLIIAYYVMEGTFRLASLTQAWTTRGLEGVGTAEFRTGIPWRNETYERKIDR
jgi:hypothetical protein